MPVFRLIPILLLLAAPAFAQEIVVRGKGISISDGDTGPTTIDGTNLGSVDILSQSSTSTFVIENTAPGTLTIGAISFSGAHAAEFSVTAQPAATVPNGGSTRFDVSFDPAATGTRTATISFPTNDPNENPFNFALRGTGISDPLIEVSGNGVVIPDGDTSPSLADHSDFGSASIGQPGITRSFTIHSVGSQDLVLESTMIRVIGGNASDFAIPAIPPSPIAPGTTASFDVVFNPSLIGPRNTTLQVISNADNAATWNFSITGLGEGPEIKVTGNGAEILDGDTSPKTTDNTLFGTADILTGTISKTFVIENNGNLDLGIGAVTFTGSHAANFSTLTPPAATVLPGNSTTIEVLFDPSIDGTHTAILEIANTDPDENPYAFTIRGTGDSDPEINVTGKGQTILAGDVSPDVVDDTDFGTLNVTGGSETHTFTIENSGSAELILDGSRSRILGGNSGDFFIVALPATPVPPGGSVSFDVTFDPTDFGPRSTTLQVTSNDSDEDPYNFSLAGFGTASAINVEGNGASIPNGDDTPKTTDHTLFGSADIDTGTISRTFTIENLGNAGLTIGTVSLAGDHAADFSVDTQPGASLGPGATTSFVIGFDPSAVGNRDAVVVIPNSDVTQDPYAFSIQGIGLSAPEIRVTGNGIDIVDGDTSPDTADHTDFGSLPVASGSITRTFTISNTGSLDLGLTNFRVRVSGGHASDFTIPALPASPVAPGGFVTFDVIFDPSAFGPRTTTLQISSNDPDEFDYNFSLQGFGTAPEINLTGKGFDIDTGDVLPITVDGTVFGSTDVLGGDIVQTFVIESLGNANLDVGLVTISGPEAADFIVITQPATTLAPLATSDIVIRFDPLAIGERNATVSISNSDPDEDPYTFAIRGFGIVAPEIRVSGNSVEIASGDTSPDTADHTDFGSLPVINRNLTRSFTIENVGSDDLALTSFRVRVSGANASDFSIPALPTTPIAPGNFVSFDVIFDPSAFGARSTTLQISSNDSDEFDYHFTLQGFGTAPEINLSGDGFDIPDGDTTPITVDGTVFGAADVMFEQIDQVFIIENLGNVDLDLGGVNITGPQAAEFSVVTAPALAIAPGASAPFKIRFDPSATGNRDATVEIPSNDPDEDPYTFAIRGIGSSAEEIDITGNGMSIADDDGSPSLADHTDFGGSDVAGGELTRVFTIHNTGSRNLSLTGFRARVIGGNQGDFVVDLPTTPIAPGASTALTVRFNPTAAGLRRTNLQVESSDGDETLYNFEIRGTGTSGGVPEIAVFGNEVEIANGDSSPRLDDHTLFGTAPIAGGAVNRQYLIHNFGGGTLNISGATLSGIHASDFAVVIPPASSVAAGAFTAMTVRFTPGAAGSRDALLSIGNNDGDEAPFTYSLQGTGRDSGELSLFGNGQPIEASTPPSVERHTHFGALLISGGSFQRTFTIQNTGSQDLSVNGLSISGTHAAEFSTAILPSFVLAVNETRDVQVDFDPDGSGPRDAVLSFQSDDPDGSLNVALQGIGAGFRVLSLEDDGGDAVIRFTTNPDTSVFVTYTYSLEYTADFPDGPWSPQQDLIGGGGAEAVLRHASGISGDHGHWRVVETPDP